MAQRIHTGRRRHTRRKCHRHTCIQYCHIRHQLLGNVLHLDIFFCISDHGHGGCFASGTGSRRDRNKWNAFSCRKTLAAHQFQQILTRLRNQEPHTFCRIKHAAPADCNDPVTAIRAVLRGRLIDRLYAAVPRNICKNPADFSPLQCFYHKRQCTNFLQHCIT